MGYPELQVIFMLVVPTIAAIIVFLIAVYLIVGKAVRDEMRRNFERQKQRVD